MLAGLAALLAVALSSGSRPAAAPLRSQVPLGPPAVAAPAGVALGVSLGSTLYGDGASRGQVGRLLDAAAAHGVRLGRADVFWNAVEQLVRDKRSFDWSVPDRVAAELADRGIRWWPVLDFSPTWASSIPGETHAPPRDDEDFALFAGTFARRYGPGGAFWRGHRELRYLPVAAYEIWNEPDSAGFWKPRPDPARYLDLYLRARNAIRAVDPRTPVIVGGLTPHPGFVAALLRARPGAGGHIDAVGLHPYGRTPDMVMKHVRSMRATLAALGVPRIPLAVTELGWQDHPRGARYYAAPTRKARYIVEAAERLIHSNCGVVAVLLFSWTSRERDPRGKDDWYGIYGARGKPTPSSRALARLLAARTRDSNVASRAAASGCR